MWNPFKKKLLQLEETTPKYRVNKIIKEYLIHKYTCTIKMVNGEIFKTDVFDYLHEATYFSGDTRLKCYYLLEASIHPNMNWVFDYQGTTMKLNSEQISYVHYTKIPFETRQVEEEVVVLIEETSNE